MSDWASYFPGSEKPDTEFDFEPWVSQPYERGRKDNYYRGLEPEITILPRIFYPDGTPVTREENTLYPDTVPACLGCALPWEAASIEPGYARAAASAAVSWFTNRFQTLTCKVGPLVDGAIWQRNGYRIAVPVYDFCSPFVLYPVADSFPNDKNWEDGAVPAYLLPAIRIQMAVKRKMLDLQNSFPEPEIPAYIVRIKGNLPTDVSCVTLYTNIAAEEKVLAALDEAVASGKLAQKSMILPKQDWLSEKEERISDANRCDTIYPDLEEYMKIRSERKGLEQKMAEQKASEESALLELADLIQGRDVKVRSANGWISLKTQPKGFTPASQAKINPEYLKILCPELAPSAIVYTSREKVSVDVL